MSMDRHRCLKEKGGSRRLNTMKVAFLIVVVTVLLVDSVAASSRLFPNSLESVTVESHTELASGLGGSRSDRGDGTTIQRRLLEEIPNTTPSMGNPPITYNQGPPGSPPSR